MYRKLTLEDYETKQKDINPNIQQINLSTLKKFPLNINGKNINIFLK